MLWFEIALPFILAVPIAVGYWHLRRSARRIDHHRGPAE